MGETIGIPPWLLDFPEAKMGDWIAMTVAASNGVLLLMRKRHFQIMLDAKETVDLRERIGRFTGWPGERHNVRHPLNLTSAGQALDMIFLTSPVFVQNAVPVFGRFLLRGTIGGRRWQHT